jgi:cytochrome c oxidase subunit IV
MPSKTTNKLCAHAHHSDHSVAAAIFANGTYFVDMLCTYFMNFVQGTGKERRSVLVLLNVFFQEHKMKLYVALNCWMWLQITLEIAHTT